MAQTYNSAVTIVRNVANSALTTAQNAQSTADSAAVAAAVANTKATFAQDRIQRFVGNQNSFSDSQPSASVLVGSKSNPILAKLTQNRTWSYTLTELVGATPSYQYAGGEYSDLIKIVNVGQTYVLTLQLQNSGSVGYEYIIQPGESLCAFYSPSGGSGSGEWLYAPSLL